MVSSFRLPRPAYLLSQVRPGQQPDSELQETITEIVDAFQLGQLIDCYRAPQSNSLNFILNTTKGKFIFREHSLSEETVAHEHQVLSFLQARNFPAPQMMTNKSGQAWVKVHDALCSLYRFVEGFSISSFFWMPSGHLELIKQAGAALAHYHEAVSDLRPTFFKWDAYRPTEHRRWREGSLYRQAFQTIRAELGGSPTATGIDDYVRLRLADFESLLAMEEVVEGCRDLSKLVIHGDYAPWNVLYRRHQAPFILDFNSARLDLKVFDIILATFFFAWQHDRLHQARAMAFQRGYAEIGHLADHEIALANKVFQWLMGRSIAERLRVHYLEQRFRLSDPHGLEKYFQMCMFARQNPKQLVAGLTGN